MVKNTMPPPFQDPNELPVMYEILEDHWEHPGRRRVDVCYEVREWITQQDDYQWEHDINTISHYRFVITPELLTMLQLKFAR